MNKKLDPVAERFLEFLDYVDDNKSQVAKKIRLDPSSVSQVSNGRSKPTKQWAALLQIEYNLNEDWLLEGKGSMFLEKDIGDKLEESLVKLKEYIDSVVEVRLQKESNDLIKKLEELEKEIKI